MGIVHFIRITWYLMMKLGSFRSILKNEPHDFLCYDQKHVGHCLLDIFSITAAK